MQGLILCAVGVACCFSPAPDAALMGSIYIAAGNIIIAIDAAARHFKART